MRIPKKHPVVRRVGFALVLTGGLALSGCGGGEPASASKVEDVREIQIDTFVFEPGEITIPSGTSVRWTNGDAILHTATSGTQKEQGVPGVDEGKRARPDGTFDLELDGKTSSATFTFDEPGTYDYFCSVHAAMTGRIVVE